MDSVATKEYWNEHWKESGFGIAPKHHPVRKWIENEIPNTKTASCIEIGCYPGKFLSVFGEKGYELNGVDSFSEINSLANWFKDKGYRLGNFYEADFFKFIPVAKYDIVASFGFIEHFENLSEVLDRHLALLKPGGKVVIDVPNLNSPIYYFLYKLFEPKTLQNHVLSVMNLEAIKSVLEAKGCQINYAGYFGYFYFRFVTKHDSIHQNIAKIINLFDLPMRLFSGPLYKRYIGVIATKQQ